MSNKEITKTGFIRFISLLTRDIILAAILYYAWLFTNSWFIDNESVLSTIIVVAVGLFSGFMISRNLHEWGHYFGAKLFGAHCPFYPVNKFGIIFDYDVKQNNEMQFAGLSWGGTLAHWAIAIAAIYLIDGKGFGIAAIQAGTIGYVAMASVIELPIIIRHTFGVPAVKAYNFNTKFIINFNRKRTMIAGVIIGIITIAISLCTLTNHI
jgi:hypothetical protein